MIKSSIARFRQNQALQEQAARRGLSGFAAIANHASITARMERGAEHLLSLLQQEKYEEVMHLMETTAWGLEEEACRITRAGEEGGDGDI